MRALNALRNGPIVAAALRPQPAAAPPCAPSAAHVRALPAGAPCAPSAAHVRALPAGAPHAHRRAAAAAGGAAGGGSSSLASADAPAASEVLAALEQRIGALSKGPMVGYRLKQIGSGRPG
jgi:hypothetical protein